MLCFELHGKSLPANLLHALGIQSRNRSAFNEVDDHVVDAIHAFEPVKTVSAAGYDNVKTIRQSLRNAITI